MGFVLSLFISKFVVETLQHNTEDPSKILEGLSHLLPPEIRETLPKMISEQSLEGYHKNKIKRLVIDLQRTRDKKKTLAYLINQVPQLVLDREELEERLTEDGDLYIRLDKQALVRNGLFTLVEGSDVYKILVRFGIHGKGAAKRDLIITHLHTLTTEVT